MADAEKQLINFQQDGPITVGTVFNSTMLDGRVVDAFGTQVMQHVQGHPGTNLLLDFANVEYLSSAALTELIRINDAVVSGGGALKLCGVSRQIQKVFEITRFDKSFDIHAGEMAAHAVARFKRAIAVSKEQDAWENRAGT